MFTVIAGPHPFELILSWLMLLWTSKLDARRINDSKKSYYHMHLQKAGKWIIQEFIISITLCFYWLLTT